MASRSPWAIRAIRTSSEAACAALNGRLAKLVGWEGWLVRWGRQDSSQYGNVRIAYVIYPTEHDCRAAFLLTKTNKGPKLVP
jgi:hypothetical protein